MLCLISCTHSASVEPTHLADSIASPTQANLDSKKIYSLSVVVDKFVLRLSEKDGQCILQYRSKGEHWEELNTNMEAPCDFIGRKIKPDPPQRFEFKQGSDQVTILLITGGAPHSAFSDEFMPKGCGTQLAKIRVYSDRVEVQPAPEPNRSPASEPTSYCPSNPLDDVFFATG